MTKYELKWAEPQRFLDGFTGGKQQYGDSFIPFFLMVMAESSNHVLKRLMESFESALRLGMIRTRHTVFDALLVHYLLEEFGRKV
jgi:hypothetical protein